MPNLNRSKDRTRVRTLVLGEPQQCKPLDPIEGLGHCPIVKILEIDPLYPPVACDAGPGSNTHFHSCFT
jgi:hypothetical protein